MASITWPSTVPQRFNQESFSNTLADNTIRSGMDVGPDKIRRITTSNTEPVQGVIIMSKTEVGYLKTFYYTTSQGGVLEFNWVDPYTEDPVEMRFVEPPKFSAIGGEYFTASLSLEIMP